MASGVRPLGSNFHVHIWLLPLNLLFKMCLDVPLSSPVYSCSNSWSPVLHDLPKHQGLGMFPWWSLHWKGRFPYSESMFHFTCLFRKCICWLSRKHFKQLTTKTIKPLQKTSWCHCKSQHCVCIWHDSHSKYTPCHHLLQTSSVAAHALACKAEVGRQASSKLCIGRVPKDWSGCQNQFFWNGT